MFTIGSQFKVNRYSVGLPDNVTLIQLSDLHFEETKEKFPLILQQLTISKITKECKKIKGSVAVVVTGDIVDKNLTDYVKLDIKTFFDNLAFRLEQVLDARNFLGFYFILGNHDYLDNPVKLIYLLDSLDYSTVLVNQFTFLSGNYDNPGILLYGCQDISQDNFPDDYVFNVGTWRGPTYKIALVHNPSVFEKDNLKYNFAKFNLALAGHTHGGQICFPGLFRRLPMWLRSFITKYRGHMCQYQNGIHNVFEIYDLKLIVSTGIGSHTPGRLFQPPSINVIT